MRLMHLAAAAAVASLGSLGRDLAASIDVSPDPVDYGPRIRHHGHWATQGSSRDTEHERHRNRLARKARRTERLHRHTATGKRLMASANGNADKHFTRRSM